MRVRAPSPWLQPFLRDFMIVEVAEEMTRLRIPEPGLVLGIRYRGSATLPGFGVVPDASIAGMSSTARWMQTSAGGGAVLARFHPDGAAPFIRESLHELFGQTLSLEDLLPRTEVEQARDRAMSALSDGERIHALERLLLARFGVGPKDPLVSMAVRELSRVDERLKVATLACRLGLSQDRLEKRFRRVVGTTPKQFACLVRLRATIDAYRPGMNLGRLAAEHGFSDQSHFNRELRAMTGMSPVEFFRREVGQAPESLQKRSNESGW